MQREIVIEKPLPGLTRIETARIVAFFTDQTCGEACWSAREEVCRCECGGRNHGINKRGQNGVRASKINGYRYELMAVGKYPELLAEVEKIIRAGWIEDGTAKLIDGQYYHPRYGRTIDTPFSDTDWFQSGYVHPTEYNKGGGQYVLKYASLAQCIRWPELEYFGIADDRDRYNAKAAILWRREDTPTYLKD